MAPMMSEATVRKTLAGPHIRARDFIEVFPLPAQRLFEQDAFIEQLPGLNTEAAEAPTGAFEGSARPQSGLRSERRTDKPGWPGKSASDGEESG
jgi:hypothetical protein